ncbi:MAG: hypothetical protein ACK5TK_03005 [Betaproteobacteria bacterium]
MSSTAAPPPWLLEDIDFSIAQPQRVRGDETLFFLLATSALVETATHHHAANLAEQYAAARRYHARQRPSRWALLRAVARRVLEAFNDDGEIAFRHAWVGRYLERPYVAAAYRRFQRELRARITPHVPVQMSARMLVKPLALPPWLARLVMAVLEFGLRRAASARA